MVHLNPGLYQTTISPAQVKFAGSISCYDDADGYAPRTQKEIFDAFEKQNMYRHSDIFKNALGSKGAEGLTNRQLIERLPDSVELNYGVSGAGYPYLELSMKANHGSVNYGVGETYRHKWYPTSHMKRMPGKLLPSLVQESYTQFVSRMVLKAYELGDPDDGSIGAL